MVDYDPHITGLCIIPWKTGNNQDTLFSLQKSTHSHPGMDFFFIKNLGRDQQKKHWSLNRPVFFKEKNKGKKFLPGFLVHQFLFASAQAAFHFTTFSFDDATYSANFAVAFDPLVDLPWLKGERRFLFTDFPWAKKKRRDSIDLFPNFPIIPKSQLRGFGVDSLAKPPFHLLRLIFLVLFKSKWRIGSFRWACSPLPSGSIWNHHQCSQYGSPNSVRPRKGRIFGAQILGSAQ